MIVGRPRLLLALVVIVVVVIIPVVSPSLGITIIAIIIDAVALIIESARSSETLTGPLLSGIIVVVVLFSS